MFQSNNAFLIPSQSAINEEFPTLAARNRHFSQSYMTPLPHALWLLHGFFPWPPSTSASTYGVTLCRVRSWHSARLSLCSSRWTSASVISVLYPHAHCLASPALSWTRNSPWKGSQAVFKLTLSVCISQSSLSTVAAYPSLESCGSQCKG